MFSWFLNQPYLLAQSPASMRFIFFKIQTWAEIFWPSQTDKGEKLPFGQEKPNQEKKNGFYIN